MPLTIEQFQAAVVESGLMSFEEVQSVLNSLAPADRPADGEMFSSLLLRRGLLTEFQTRELVSGGRVPLVLGDYVLVDRIGAGGMGQVYKATHRRMKRHVAVKLLPQSLAGGVGAIKRFEREVEAAAKLVHPNIVQAYDAGVQRGIWYLVMEFVDGLDLAKVIAEQGPLPVNVTVDFVRQAARGLAFAHQSGIIHRDIKPANLLLDKTGCVKVLDLGLARFEDRLSDDAGLTQSGNIMGSVDYMAPEQAFNSHTADARADIYSLGCTLFHLLTGRYLYCGETPGQKLMAHQGQPIPTLEIPEWNQSPNPLTMQLNAVFRKMVAKRPEDRFGKMTDVETALESIAKQLSEQRTSGERILNASVDLSPTSAYVRPRNGTLAVTQDAIESPHRESSTAVTAEAIRPKRRSIVVFAFLGAASLLAAIWFNYSRLWSSTTASPHTGASIRQPVVVIPNSATELLTSSDFKWSTPENLGPGVNTHQAEITPWLSADGLSLYYASFRASTESDLFVSQRKSIHEPFGTGQPVENVNSSSRDSDPCLTADGRTLFFNSNRPGGQGKFDIWFAHRNDSNTAWSPPENLGPTVNNSGDQRGPHTINGLDLFHVNVDQLFIARRTSAVESFQPSTKLLGGFPVGGSTSAPSITMDGRSIIFARFDEAKSMILLATRTSVDQPFGIAKPLPGFSIGLLDTSPSISADGSTLVFQSDRAGGQGFTDLWLTRRIPK